MRFKTNEIYFEVLREVIINAIVHRDYSIEQANINVKIDDEKILVESPGKPIIALKKPQNCQCILPDEVYRKTKYWNGGTS